MTIRIGHSPDSDDAFMFWGLASGAVKSELRFEHVLKDIQTLNEWAKEGKLESSAVSVHAFAYVADKYALLRHGGSFGDGYGPMVVARRPLNFDELRNTTIAVPGTLTSAFLQLCLWFDEKISHKEIAPLPVGEGVGGGVTGRGSEVAGIGSIRNPKSEIQNPKSDTLPSVRPDFIGTHRSLPSGEGSDFSASGEGSDYSASGEGLGDSGSKGSGFAYEVIPFDQIIPAIQEGRFEAGLIIHEGQLTFEKEGLVEIANMGKWWKKKTGLPLPLGVNVVRKNLGEDVCAEVSRCMRESIEAGLSHRKEALDYALQFARGMDVSTSDQFVGMYVNERTRDMGEEGIEAIKLLLSEGAKAGIVPEVTVDAID